MRVRMGSISSFFFFGGGAPSSSTHTPSSLSRVVDLGGRRFRCLLRSIAGEGEREGGEGDRDGGEGDCEGGEVLRSLGAYGERKKELWWDL